MRNRKEPYREYLDRTNPQYIPEEYTIEELLQARAQAEAQELANEYVNKINLETDDYDMFDDPLMLATLGLATLGTGGVIGNKMRGKEEEKVEEN